MCKSFYVSLLVGALVLAGCSTHPSPQQTMVDDRYMVYKEMEKAYRAAEE
jgi:PBP1b-binding outer membrane lipoprotein LpoB